MAWINFQDDIFRLFRDLLKQKVERENIKLRVEREHVDPFDPDVVTDHLFHHDMNEPEFCEGTGMLS